MRTVCPQGHYSARSDFCDVCGARISSSQTLGGMSGRHHAPEPFVAGDGEICPRCGAAVAGQFCETCGFRASAQRPFAPFVHPAESSSPVPVGSAEPRETVPSGRASSGPPESLFPPIAEPESAFAGWSRPDLTVPAVTPAPSAPPTTPIPSLTSVPWTVLVASDRVYYNKMREARGSLSSAVEFPAHTSERRIRLVGKQMRIGRRSPARDLVPEIDLADQPVDPGVSRLHAVMTHGPDGTWSILDPGSANGTLVNGQEIAVGEMVTLHEGDRINLGAWTVITVHRG